MKKPPICQVRIEPELAAEMEEMRKNFPCKVSLSSYANVVIRAGIKMIKRESGDSAASSLSK